MIDTVPVEELACALDFAEPLTYPAQWRHQPLARWTMEADDFALRYVFRQYRPLRHLEFGTWRGDGVLRCVEECDATVWTINPPQGESNPDGSWTYSEKDTEAWTEKTPWSETLVTESGVWVRTDAYGLIGRKYLAAGWGKRVCQVYADSREWDTRAYPDGFFDTVFIDGGHSHDVVASDTRQATRLVRPGGLVIWHDYCPVEEVTRACASTRDVVAFITSHVEELRTSFARLFWIEPSWLLVGIRAT